MKKLLCTILAFILLLSLCACGQKAPSNTGTNNGGNDTQNNISSEPTEEEKEQILKYVEAIYALKEYEKEGSVPKYQTGEDAYAYNNEALGYWYQDILNAECVEKWAGTEYASYAGINWNRQEVLDSFVILEDVKLAIQESEEDFLGNVSIVNRNYMWEYTEDGRIRYSDDNIYISHTGLNVWDYSEFVNYTPIQEGYYLYDENGKMEKVFQGSYDAPNVVGIPTYDEKWNLINVEFTYARTGEKHNVDYTYDSNNHLTKKVYSMNDRTKSWSYAYDEDGKVIMMKEELDPEFTKYSNGSHTVTTIEYSYDSDGYVTSAKYVNSYYTHNAPVTQQEDSFIYTHDSKGRIQTITINEGDRMATENHYNGAGVLYTPSCARKFIEIIYGNYYVYKPAMEE